MTKPPRHDQAPGAPSDQTEALNSKVTSKFAGTENPRELRVLQVLRVRPTPREELDRIAGCSNGPDLVAGLRRRGLELPCQRARKLDRDLFPCYPGVYQLSQADRRKIAAWLRKRKALQGVAR